MSIFSWVGFTQRSSQFNITWWQLFLFMRGSPMGPICPGWTYTKIPPGLAINRAVPPGSMTWHPQNLMRLQTMWRTSEALSTRLSRQHLQSAPASPAVTTHNPMLTFTNFKCDSHCILSTRDQMVLPVHHNMINLQANITIPSYFRKQVARHPRFWKWKYQHLSVGIREKNDLMFSAVCSLWPLSLLSLSTYTHTHTPTLTIPSPCARGLFSKVKSCGA